MASDRIVHRHRAAALWGAIVFAAAAVATAAEPAAVVCTVDTTGGALTGRLEAVDPAGLRLAIDGQTRSLPLDAVRSVVRAGDAAAPSALAVTCTDGSILSGTDVAWQGDRLTISHPVGPITLPMARVRSIAWHDAAGADRWQGALPAGIESDMLVVRKGDDFEFVECAITGITADAVSVVLDEETIPVKRAKVMGLVWLRQPEPAGGVMVRIDGGSVAAAKVSWTPAGMMIDETIALPADVLREIDYASGRMVHVAALAPERVDVEPFFGSLGKAEGLEAYFAPRAVPATAGGRPVDLVIRPRTVAVWRIPADSREFRTGLSAAAAAGAGPMVIIAVDDREVFRGPVDRRSAAAGPIPVGPLPVSGGRRLHVTVDYGSAAAAAGTVVLHDPVLSK